MICVGRILFRSAQTETDGYFSGSIFRLMQSVFTTYLQLGYRHILDPNGYDHMVFLIALCAVYTWKEWRQVLLLVTAFTVGHSLTLALAALDLIRVPSDLIEFLIPLTIFLTALFNVLKKETTTHNMPWRYGSALVFGLIHGMGFSNFLKASLLPGEAGNIVGQLFAFNLGVELGQLLFVALILAVAMSAFRWLNVQQRAWTLFVSGAAAGIALILMAERVGMR